MTLTLIQTATVGAGGTSSVTFSGISGAYTDLYLVSSARSASTDSVGYIRFNGVTTNLSCRYVQGNGSTVTSSTDASNIQFTINRSDTTSNTFSNTSAYIANYAGSANKVVSVEGISESNGTGTVHTHTLAGLWSNTAAITSITLVTAGGNNFAQYSTFSLYGVTKGSGGATVS